MNEIWKKVKGFEDYYEVSNIGRVKNSKGRILKPYINNKGYKCIKFQIKRLLTYYLIHRLVAENFIPNPNNYPCVDHIDSNKQNCSDTNLEWVTQKENMQRASKKGLLKNNGRKEGNKLKNRTSKYHYVCWDSNRNKWMIRIVIKNKEVFVKRFTNEIDAAMYVNLLIDKLQLTKPKNKI